MGFTKDALDTFISKKIGAVTAVGASDLSAEFPGISNWVSGLGLCIIFQDHPQPSLRQHTLHFMRRVEMAFSEYSRATQSLRGLVEGVSGRWSPYYRTLYHFEAAIAQLYLTYDSNRKLLGRDSFRSGDGSVLERLNKVFNASKHGTADTEQPVWISNDGVHCELAAVSFAELEDLLRGFGALADAMLSQPTPAEDA